MKKFLPLILMLAMVLAITSALADTSLPTYNLNSQNCTGWEVQETKTLNSNFICIGDVEVNGVARYDEGGIGEDTIVINLSKNPVMVFAPYGAQMQTFTEVPTIKELETQIALQEFSRYEKYQDRSQYRFHTLRFVIIPETGETYQYFLGRADFFNK